MSKVVNKLKYEFSKVRDYLQDNGFYYNKKQKVWLKAVNSLRKKTDLVVLETGRIRNPKWKASDGNSTHFFTLLKQVQKLYSVDNDSENFSGHSTSEAYCNSYLKTFQKEKLKILNGDSVEVLDKLSKDIKFDVVLLDSANDPNLIFNEYKKISNNLAKESILIVDDITPPGKKGDILVSHLIEKGIRYSKEKVFPSDCIIFYFNE